MKRLHRQTITDDPHGRFWRYGRLYLRWYPDGGEHKDNSWEVGWQWCLLRKGSLGFAIGTGGLGGEHPFHMSVHLGRIGAWYFTGAGGIFTWLRNRLTADAFPYDRQLSLSMHNGFVCWNLWTAEMGYNPKARWREQCWSWKRFIGWEPEHVRWETLEVVHTVVPMPEGTYDATVEIKRGTWKRRRLFAWCPSVHRFSSEITPDRPIPVPGKGENSWDCGDDAIHSSSGPGRTVHEAVSRLVDSAYHQRINYGSGPEWQPQQKAT